MCNSGNKDWPGTFESDESTKPHLEFVKKNCINKHLCFNIFNKISFFINKLLLTKYDFTNNVNMNGHTSLLRIFSHLLPYSSRQLTWEIIKINK